jgi:hypothetical protein
MKTLAFFALLLVLAPALGQDPDQDARKAFSAALQRFRPPPAAPEPPQAPARVPTRPQEPAEPAKRPKACLCSPQCVCGCNEGRECQCVHASPAPVFRPALPGPAPSRFIPSFRPSFGPSRASRGGC